ncbi:MULTISPECIES: amidase family protein [Nocardiopsis]|uniref:Amidase domain-containing protein n=1 Tax=Nocardiopsis sinuspersici TaxID=501010 RepID=A0A1V3BZ34_9ACTN|nr:MULTISPECIES: amidase family protein [Nocardiopsis]OOC53807.1 hypothetical protein NOSIN_08320 [Nocardiopsis sinuspersici]
MEIHEYTRLDAVALAELVHTGQVTAAEVEHTARRALERAHADLNALTGPLYDPVPDHAPNGPLGGVPFVVKDSGPFVRGTPFCLGSRALVGAVAHTDHALMTRFRAAGLAALGQSTVPELALSLATESRRYGTTRNPWSPERGVGGSSGGAAALVAAGAVPLAHGSDGGGSLRVPASACGLVGLKPSRGRTPCGPLTGEAGFGMVGEFALTRTVRDTAFHRAAEYAPFSAPANVAGLPALSLPLAQSREGLPIGVQLMAAPGREDVLLAVGSQLQQAAPWEGRCPPLHV